MRCTATICVLDLAVTGLWVYDVCSTLNARPYYLGFQHVHAYQVLCFAACCCMERELLLVAEAGCQGHIALGRIPWAGSGLHSIVSYLQAAERLPLLRQTHGIALSQPSPQEVICVVYLLGSTSCESDHTASVLQGWFLRLEYM